MTQPQETTMLRELVKSCDPETKNAILLELIRWADSDEGRDERASFASDSNNESAVTALDVLALLPAEQASEVCENLGLDHATIGGSIETDPDARFGVKTQNF